MNTDQQRELANIVNSKNQNNQNFINYLNMNKLQHAKFMLYNEIQDSQRIIELIEEVPSNTNGAKDEC